MDGIKIRDFRVGLQTLEEVQTVEGVKAGVYNKQDQNDKLNSNALYN